MTEYRKVIEFREDLTINGECNTLIKFLVFPFISLVYSLFLIIILPFSIGYYFVQRRIYYERLRKK